MCNFREDHLHQLLQEKWLTYLRHSLKPSELNMKIIIHFRHRDLASVFLERDRIQAEGISIDSRKLEDRTFLPQVINEVRYLKGTDQPESSSY